MLLEGFQTVENFPIQELNRDIVDINALLLSKS